MINKQVVWRGFGGIICLGMEHKNNIKSGWAHSGFNIPTPLFVII